jgi:hypothetical protein
MSMCASDVETWMGYCGKCRSNTSLSYSTSCMTTTLRIRKIPRAIHYRLAVVHKWTLSRSCWNVLFKATHFAFVLGVWRTWFRMFVLNLLHIWEQLTYRDANPLQSFDNPLFIFFFTEARIFLICNMKFHILHVSLYWWIM